MFSCRTTALASSLALVALLAGCASKAPAPVPAKKPAGVQCQAAQAGDPLIGTWLSMRKEKGIAGEMRTLFVLMPSGKMDYAEQVKRGRLPPQGLSESGCWHRDKQDLVLRTTESNGVPVELNDPIYTNQYRITSLAGKALVLKGPDGVVRARRMPDGYRLPY